MEESEDRQEEEITDISRVRSIEVDVWAPDSLDREDRKRPNQFLSLRRAEKSAEYPDDVRS